MHRVFARILQQDINIGIGAATKPNPGGGVLTGTQVGIHSFAEGQGKVSVSWTPGSVVSGGKASFTVNVPGAALGDFVLQSFSLDLQEMQLSASVISANTVEVVVANLTGSSVILAEGTLSVLVLKAR